MVMVSVALLPIIYLLVPEAESLALTMASIVILDQDLAIMVTVHLMVVQVLEMLILPSLEKVQVTEVICGQRRWAVVVVVLVVGEAEALWHFMLKKFLLIMVSLNLTVRRVLRITALVPVVAF